MMDIYLKIKIIKMNAKNAIKVSTLLKINKIKMNVNNVIILYVLPVYTIHKFVY